MQREWLVGMAVVVISVCAAVGLAIAGSDQGARIGRWPVFVLCAGFAYGAQWLMFTQAWLLKSERNFDLTGSVTYIVMMLMGGWLSGADDVRSWTLVGLICIWALRLGPFLHRRTKSAGGDRRFRHIRHSFPTFLMTWTLQGNWVFITGGCALAAVTSGLKVPVDIWYVVGLMLWTVGFVVEVVSDRQKSAFRSDPQNADHFISSGLWAWSRHPNYFGEIVLWLGIAIIARQALQGWQVLTLVSPLFVVLLLTAISGVRMLEARATKKWGDDPSYRAYRASTPSLIMWPPRKSPR